MKFKTVKEGQQALILNHRGEARLVAGPERVFLFRKRLEFLKVYRASQYDYLAIRDKNGQVEHKNGPCEVFLNPMKHESINVKTSIKIDANHVVVVYKTGPDNAVERKVIQGPSVFVPEPEQWLHEFCWHGVDASDKTRMIPGYNKFTQLAIIPDQFYYNVRDVRTIDDTMITVKLMIFYSLKDILKMLENTHDPIADMINAMCADVIAFAGRLTYEEFVQGTHKLSSGDLYSQLQQRSERIGYDVTKVVYRGYHANQQLQIMHDNAIQSRTQLRLNNEVQEQQEKLTEFKLKLEEARTMRRQEMEQSKQRHHQNVEQLRQEHNLVMKQSMHEEQLKKDSLKTLTLLDLEKSSNEQKLEFLTTLKSLGVDLTQYLNSQQPAPIDKEIRVT